MKIVDGKKMKQDEIDIEFIRACTRGDLASVVKWVDGYGANVNSMDALNYARALIYALRGCDGARSEGELVIRYLVNHGAEINFKHGDKQTYNDSRPYFIYWVAACNSSQVSDDLVEFLIKKGASEVLEYVPTTKSQNYSSAKDIIKQRRPKLYEKLVKQKVVKDSSRR